MKRILRSQDGMMTIAVLALLGLIGFLGFEMLQWSQRTGKQDVDAILLHQSIAIARGNLLAIAQNYEPIAGNPTATSPALDWTFFRSSAFQCIQTDADCAAVSGPITLYGSNGTLFYDSTNASQGFMLNGMPCTGYSATPSLQNGPSGCVLRVDLTWKPSCFGISPCMIDTANAPPNSIVLNAAFSTPGGSGSVIEKGSSQSAGIVLLNSGQINSSLPPTSDVTW